MKKIIGSVAILLALLSISGCGSSSGDSTLNGATPDNPAPNNPVAAHPKTYRAGEPLLH